MATTDPNAVDAYQGKYAANTAQATTAPANGYQDAINKQITQLQAPVTADSTPAVAAQIDSARAGSARGLASNRDALAERAYGGGTLNTGGYDQDQQKAREAASASEGSTEAGILANADNSRQSALTADLGTGLSGALSQEQITNQGNQFGSQLGLNYDQIAAQKAAQQAAINAQLSIAKDQNNLGYYGVDSNANLTTRGQDISAAGAL